MAIKLSTALRNAMLGEDSLKGRFSAWGVIYIYAGTVPADADAAIGSATLLCTITTGGLAAEALVFDSPEGGVLPKAEGSAWQGVNVATGVATFYRLADADDLGSALVDAASSSPSDCRIQGTVGVAGADLNLTSTSLVTGATQAIDFYTLELPSY